MNKKIIVTVLAFVSIAANAQNVNTTSTANQSTASNSTAQGQINVSAAPSDQHLSETVRNVPSIALGSYASSFSQMNCGQTTQAAISVAGLGIGGGSSTSLRDCKLEVAAAETVRQSTVTNDTNTRDKLQQAAINIRCQVSEEVYNAMIDAGLVCSRKPEGMVSRTDTQPESTRIASSN